MKKGNNTKKWDYTTLHFKRPHKILHLFTHVCYAMKDGFVLIQWFSTTVGKAQDIESCQKWLYVKGKNYLNWHETDTLNVVVHYLSCLNRI
jgi:hypothetical protein